jgi:hypothetical protein
MCILKLKKKKNTVKTNIFIFIFIYETKNQETSCIEHINIAVETKQHYVQSNGRKFCPEL